MVDVGGKAATRRTAVAEAVVRMSATAHKALKTGSLKKGDALAAAQTAGIFAAKRTADLIPLCHPLALSRVDVSIRLRGRDAVVVTCVASCYGPTGVEMEAMTGASIAALTVYDMCKALDRGITIESVRLLKKTGGKSGAYRR
jgi:cyclic pyranopterin monophosphate synthase